ncbi:S9 family peptidase [Massilia yuzhufengensis]|uniref:Dipeptidyl aminopeptidase/acylaminoacyl peptidase n=1 Tax=Massilia yuzhufengensis TaxID=1164594 RepID=A0A1I1PGF9_9BURK|nr:prolyl oligopeptidase family serine peptidase [Massilia yuzhufengensis]SFD05140.1 Dipeptidyl aminopeptidase/acylaminoacyl peptidase [Massilia yuzhufengensis]
MRLAHRPLGLTLIATLFLAAGAATGQEASIAAPAAMVLENVPPVRAGLAAQVAKYNEFKPTSYAAWHPTRLEMIVARRHDNTPQLFRVARPGAPLELMTDYAEPVRSAQYEPRHGKYYVFGRDSGGNEVFRAYRRDAGTRAGNADAIPITPDNRRVQDTAWAKASGKLLYVTVPVGRQGSNDSVTSTVSLADPLQPEQVRILAELPGGGWNSFVFSHDDKQLVYSETVSANESYLWLMDVASGKSRRLTDKTGGDKVAYSGAVFARDGRGLYATSDRGSEFRRLVHIDLASGMETVLTPGIEWDIDDISLSKDGKLLAFVANEDGTSVLRMMRTSDRKLVAQPKLPVGVIGRIEWHDNSRNLALSLASARSPSEVYSVDAKTGAVTRWTTHEKMEVDMNRFVEPSLVRWKSFDGRMISGFAYRAPGARFPGKRPVMINIHGGPEGQSTPGFLGRSNYYTDEMGITVIYPNVRGSAGYGKSFLKLDNGMLREDSVRDIGALLDWIATQPDMDATRVAVVGGSYGGYMTLAVSTMYPERIAAAIDIVGISNIATFLERTESYRRDLRRVEYGDERDPEMRKWMDATAPASNAAKIRKPLFVVQGKNDPRVPWQEADQMVATVKKNGTPVWYMTANDEGHGFAKKLNADYLFYAGIDFFNTYLLK